MFGRPESGGPASDRHEPFFASRWVDAPDARHRARRRAAAGFRAAGVACGLKPSGAPDLGLLVSTRRTRSAPRASRAPACAPRRCCCAASAARLDALRAVVANSGNANAAHRPARARGRGADAGRGRDRGRRGPEDQRRGRLDRRDRRAARRSTRSMQRDRAAPPASCAPTATTPSPRRSAPPTRSPSAPALDVELPGGTVRLTAQAKGAGMISPAFATMLCFVQTDAALSAETADLLLGGASSARSTASASTASSPPTTP